MKMKRLHRYLHAPPVVEVNAAQIVFESAFMFSVTIHMLHHELMNRNFYVFDISYYHFYYYTIQNSFDNNSLRLYHDYSITNRRL